MSAGLLLHLSAPQQSWGGPQGGNVRDTHPHPTRSALRGLIAAAQGRARGSDMTDLDALTYTVRVDRQGRRLMDFHTIGGGYPEEHTVMTANGGRRGSALLFEDWYLNDAAFTVAVTGPAPLIAQSAAALRNPVYPPYLGRRSCPPDTPVLIAQTEDAEAALDHLPLHRTAPRGADTVEVTFLSEHAPAQKPTLPHTRKIQDAPLPGRAWTTRKVWETPRQLPAGLCAGRGTAYLNALAEYRSAA
ncbi:type I-E CRISPR-associated protein Cas5/CasD [Streptomyces decoyicus]|uniref:type I-E CRISPR-associated protein Cas5/CasD n=1 Tax=Streptomyces decoyicus TaxID=249567 RepID=UPI0038704CF0